MLICCLVLPKNTQIHIQHFEDDFIINCISFGISTLDITHKNKVFELNVEKIKNLL